MFYGTLLETRFSKHAATSAKLIALVPSILLEMSSIDISDTIEFYKGDLPSPELMDQELMRWKIIWQKLDASTVPTSCAQAIKECDKASFPNIFNLLKLACTLPITSCECERSASGIRRLNTFARACMKEDRLSSLSLIHCHYDHPIEYRQLLIGSTVNFLCGPFFFFWIHLCLLLWTELSVAVVEGDPSSNCVSVVCSCK